MRSAMRVLCFRSRAWRRRYIGCAFGVVALLLVSFLAAHDQLPSVMNISCKNDFSAEGIRKICSSVAVGSSGGSFCDELCSSKEVKDAECLGHGVKDDVVLLHLKERKVVLKSLKDKYESFVQSSLENVDPDAEHTMSALDIHVKNGLGFIGVDATIEELSLVERTIFKECDADGNSLLSYSELTVCLQLAFTEEYVFSQLLEGNPAVPVVYGTCGAQIAVEYIDVNPFGRTWHVSPFVTATGSWQERAAMAIAFLDLVESIEHTPHGVLFLCDVQTSNFGLQRLDNGRYRAVAIDLDISFFEKAMASAIVQQDTCTSDEDCDFINCKSKCINGHCTKRLHSSNLQCSSVAVGSSGGSFCDELCSSKEVKDAECLGHAVEDDVVLLHLKERKVVMKSLKDKYDSLVQSSLENVDPDAEHTMSVLDIHVRNGLGFIGVDATIEELSLVERTIFKECDADGNSLLSYSELTVCLQLAFTEEYVFSLLLEGNPAVPVVYGTCGAQIAVEYIEVNPFGRTWHVSPFVTVNGSWQERAAMAIAFLDLVESIEHTPHGVLFLCDVQTSNFGLQRLDNGRYRAVAIDLDISFFEKAMASAIVQQDVCTSDGDCDYIYCKSKCINGHCTKRLHSSNLQVICEKILTDYGYINSGLLFDPPHSIRAKVRYFLTKCIHPDKLLYYSNQTLVHSDLILLRAMRKFLRHSISSV